MLRRRSAKPPPTSSMGKDRDPLNPLLTELETAELRSVLPDDAEHERTLRLLSWRRITDLLARGCRSRRAADALRGRRPLIDLHAIALRHDLLDELRGTPDGDDPPPLLEVGDALDLLDRPRPWRFDGGDLIHLATIARALDALRDWMMRREDRMPRWADGARALASLNGLADPIERILDRDGRVRDDARPRLSKLRRESREAERRVRGTITGLFARAQAKGWTNGPEVTLRGDRFCLPLQSGSKRKVDGIVHDRSSTGGTVFVEPAELVPLQNDLAEVRLEAAAEVERLLLSLGSLVDLHAGAFRDACALMIRMDEWRAVLAWSRAVDGVRPAIEPGARPSLRRASHPLLLAQAAGAAGVVPLDLEWPEGCRALVISGPNAGGKSVALKGVGVLILMAQCGWDIPAAAGSVLPRVTRLSVDLGDDQSIARSLSSFSAHLDHLGRFLATADADTLVLCDEIGSGTDPDEGTALAFAVLEDLVERGALVLASTHYGLLKAAVHEHPQMSNAAMDFDERTLAPLYTLRIGVPGASHAFDIASRMSFPAALLNRARERVGEERFRIERLLAELSARARRLAEAEQASTLAAADAERRADELARRLDGIAGERDRLLKTTRREGEALLEEARRTLETTVRDLKSDGADSRTIRYGRDALDALAQKLPRPARPGPPARIAVGGRIRIPHLGWTGVVVEIRGERIVADAQGVRLTLSRDDVEDLQDAAPPAASPAPATDWTWRRTDGPVVQEVDVRGFRADEAWDALDRMLDRAIPAGTQEISVIHGHGTGRLRDHLRQRLATDPRVASFHDAPEDAGSSGRTIILLNEAI